MKQALGGGVVGAALAVAVMVTVHEGSVNASTQRGVVTLTAGERVRLLAGTTPEKILDAQHTSSMTVVESMLREKERELIETKRELERVKKTALSPTSTPKHQRAGEKERTYVDTPHEELIQRATDCKLVVDLPNIFGKSPPSMGRYGFTPAERATADCLAASLHSEAVEGFRAFYVGVTRV